jgi:hypothetical protein
VGDRRRHPTVSRRTYAAARVRYAVRCWLARRKRCSHCARHLSYGPDGGSAAHIAGLAICGRCTAGDDYVRPFAVTMRDADIARGEWDPEALIECPWCVDGEFACDYCDGTRRVRPMGAI